MRPQAVALIPMIGPYDKFAISWGYSPIGGTVVQRKVGPGQFISSGATDPVFVKVWPPASLADEGKDFFGTWLLSDTAVSQGERLQLELRTDGTVQMRDRCNDKSGRWRIDHNAATTITFTDVAITAMACPNRPDVLDVPCRAQIAANGELLVEETTGRQLAYTRA